MTVMAVRTFAFPPAALSAGPSGSLVAVWCDESVHSVADRLRPAQHHEEPASDDLRDASRSVRVACSVRVS